MSMTRTAKQTAVDSLRELAAKLDAVKVELGSLGRLLTVRPAPRVRVTGGQTIYTSGSKFSKRSR
jgi:hypothetical protein